MVHPTIGSIPVYTFLWLFVPQREEPTLFFAVVVVIAFFQNPVANVFRLSMVGR